MKKIILSILKPFGSMPPLLSVLFFSFLSLPLVSFFLLGVPTGALPITALWIAPLALSWATLRKQGWILPLFTSQCILLGILALVGGSAGPAASRLAHFSLIGFMLYLAFLQKRDDALYPLLTRNVQFWRRSARFEIGRNVFLSENDTGKKIPAVLQDCSATGMAISLSLDEFRQGFRDSALGLKFQVDIPADAEGKRPSYSLPVELVWKAEAKVGEGKLGCRTLNTSLTQAYLESEGSKRKAQLRLSETNDDFRLEQDIQRSALILWLVSAGLAFFLPF